jgi:Na+/melibiose symporter-like transporter
MRSSAPPLRFATRCLYGLGQAAEGINATAFNLFALFYYNQVLGLSGALAGLALGIALVVDAIVDPLIGVLSDAWRSPLGRRHPFMYASVLPLAISFALLFNPQVQGEASLFAWLLAFSILARASISVFTIPHFALGAELSEEPSERTAIVTHRQFFSVLGAALVIGLGFGGFLADAPGAARPALDPRSYGFLAIALSFAMAVAMSVSAVGTQQRARCLPQPGSVRPGAGVKRALAWMFSELRGVLRNRSFRALFAGVLVLYSMVGVDAALYLHFTTFFWEITSSEQTYYWGAFTIGVLLGSSQTVALCRRFEKRSVLIGGTAGWALFQILPAALRLFELLPPNRTQELFAILLVIACLKGACVVQAWIVYGSMLADVADEYDLETGRRSEGTLFAAVSFANQAMSGIGSVLAGLILELLAWPTGATIVSAAQIPAEKLFWIGVLYGPLVGGFSVLGIAFYARYRIDRARHAQILAQLHVRSNV